MDLTVTGAWKAGYDLMKQILSLCPGQDLNPAPPENEYFSYQAEVLWMSKPWDWLI